MTYSCRETLTLALSAALAARRTSVPSQLLDGHGSFIFALALAALPSRKMAEVLFMLTPAERADAYRRLSYDDRARLAQVGMVNPNEPACAPLQRPIPRPAITAHGRVGKSSVSGRSSNSLSVGVTR